MVNLGNMMKQAQQLQKKMSEAQEKLKSIEVEGISGGGMVKVKANAKGEIKKIDIDKDIYQNNTKLDELFSFYKTDKANYINSEKNHGHGYAEFYEKHFSNLRDKKLNILEIGSYSGASAAAFVKYFKDINIYCLDINLTKFLYKSKKIHPFGLDVSNKKMIDKFLNKINFKKLLTILTSIIVLIIFFDFSFQNLIFGYLDYLDKVIIKH